jgi:hypothetical protein
MTFLWFIGDAHHSSIEKKLKKNLKAQNFSKKKLKKEVSIV